MQSLQSTSPWAFAPVGVEIVVSTGIYLIATLKRKARGNFPLLITYSALKILAVASMLTSSLNFFNLANLPFLAGLLLNEVVLLVWVIREKNRISSVAFSSMYSKRIRALQAIGSLMSMVIFAAVTFAMPFVPCTCTAEHHTLRSLFKNPNFAKVVPDVSVTMCKESSIVKSWGEAAAPQIRGLSFAISITASVVSISGLRFLLMSFTGDLLGKRRDNLVMSTQDQPWKKAVRTAYAILSIVTNLLFIFCMFVPGLRQCVGVKIFGNEEPLRFVLSPLTTSLINAILAIGQMFVADLLLRSCSDPENKPHTDSYEPNGFN